MKKSIITLLTVSLLTPSAVTFADELTRDPGEIVAQPHKVSDTPVDDPSTVPGEIVSQPHKVSDAPSDTLQKDGTFVIEKAKEVPFDVVYTEDASVAEGEEVVIAEGVTGIVEVLDYAEVTNGKVTNTWTEEVVIRHSEPRVIGLHPNDPRLPKLQPMPEPNVDPGFSIQDDTPISIPEDNDPAFSVEQPADEKPLANKTVTPATTVAETKTATLPATGDSQSTLPLIGLMLLASLAVFTRKRA